MFDLIYGSDYVKSGFFAYNDISKKQWEERRYFRKHLSTGKVHELTVYITRGREEEVRAIFCQLLAEWSIMDPNKWQYWMKEVC